MVPYGLTVNGTARGLAVPPERFSEIVRGRRAITADTALRLGRLFRTSPRFWLNLQNDYDLQIAQSAWSSVQRRIRPLPRDS